MIVGDGVRRARLSRVARGRFIQAMLAETGGVWPDLEGLIAAIYAATVRPGDTVLDVGVNHGTHLFQLAGLVGPAGRVIGVEAVPEFARHVEAGLGDDLRDRVTIHNCAVSAEEGRADFYVTSITDGGMSGLKLRPVIKRAGYERISVPVRTLDTLIAGENVRFAKIDIEGAEYDALRGASMMLASRPLIVFEFDAQAPSQFGFAADDLLGLLRRHGYRVYDIFGFEVANGATMMKARVWNFVAVPPELDVEANIEPAQRKLAELVPGVGSLLPALSQAPAS